MKKPNTSYQFTICLKSSILKPMPTKKCKEWAIMKLLKKQIQDI